LLRGEKKEKEGGKKHTRKKKDIMGIYRGGRIKYERMKSSSNV